MQMATDGQIDENSVVLPMFSGTSFLLIISQPSFPKNLSAVVVSKKNSLMPCSCAKAIIFSVIVRAIPMLRYRGPTASDRNKPFLL